MIRIRLLAVPKPFTEDTFDVHVGTYAVGEKKDGGIGYLDQQADGPGEFTTETIAFSDLYGDPEQATSKQNSDVELALRIANRQLMQSGAKTVAEAERFFDTYRESEVSIRDGQPHTLYVPSTTAPELDNWLPCEIYEDSDD